MKQWVVYIIQCSDKKKSLYTGITNDFRKRLSAHTNGAGAKYTRGRAPFKLIKLIKVRNKSCALKLEHKIKNLSKNNKLFLSVRKMKEMLNE